MKLITLTPLHISSDTELTQSEFILEGNRVKAYPLDYLLNYITKKIDSYEKREILVVDLKRAFLSSEGPLNLKEFFSKHRLNIPPTFEVVSAVGEISGNIKLLPWCPQGPYIPGSEIKGALRFLFVYGVLRKDSSLRQDLVKNLKKILSEKFSGEKEERRAFIERVEGLWQRYENIITRPEEQQEAQYDLFRSLSISDSEPLTYSSLYVDRIMVLNTGRSIGNFVLAVKPYEKVRFHMNFMDNFSEVLAFCEKYYRWRYRSFLNLKFFREAGYDLFKTWLKYELGILQRLTHLSPSQKQTYENNLKKLEELMEKFYQSGERFIPVRLGRFQGFMTITLSLLLKMEDEALFQTLFSRVVPRVSSTVNKTRSVTAGQFMPPGWAVLHV